MSPTLFTNPLSYCWRKDYLEQSTLRQRNLPIIYLMGLVGYALSTPHRVMKVALDVVFLIGGIAQASNQSSFEPVKKSFIHLFQDLAELPAVLIGIACPPLAYRIDAWVCRATGRKASYFEDQGYQYIAMLSGLSSEDVRNSLEGFDPAHLEEAIARSLTNNLGDEEVAARELASLKSICQQAGTLCGQYGSSGELDLALLVRIVLLLYLQKSDQKVLKEREVRQYVKVIFNGEDFEKKLGELRETFEGKLKEHNLIQNLINEWMQTNPVVEDHEQGLTFSQRLMRLAGRYESQDRVGASWMLQQATASFNQARPKELYDGEAVGKAVGKAYEGLSTAEKQTLGIYSNKLTPEQLSQVELTPQQLSKIKPMIPKQLSQAKLTLEQLLRIMLTPQQLAQVELTPQQLSRVKLISQVSEIKDFAASMMLFFFVTSLSEAPEGNDELAIKTKEAYAAYQGYRQTGRSDDLETMAKRHFRGESISFPNRTISVFLDKINELKETYMEEEGCIFGTLLKQCHHPSS